MNNLPTIDASDDDWYEFAQRQGDQLMSHLAPFLSERFSYKPSFVAQKLWRSGRTVTAFTTRYDLYFRLFVRPNAYWPRDCLVLARLYFGKPRSGHGRALVEKLLDLAPELGYGSLVIECANPNASAFAKRLGFTPYEKGNHWVGTVENIREALGHQTDQGVGD